MPQRNLGPDVYNVWLDQSQECGQNYSTHTVLFDRRHIFSYGRHYLLGVLHHHRNGAPWVLLNSDDHRLNTGKISATTPRHRRALWSACHRRRIETLTVSFRTLHNLGLPHTVEGPLEPEAVAATLVARQDHARVA